MTTFGDVKDFAQRAPSLAGSQARAVQGAAVDVLLERFERLLLVLTPVGGILSPPRTGKTAHSPGLTKRSYFTRARRDGGVDGWIGNRNLPVWTILNRGRKRSKDSRRRAATLEARRKRREGKAVRGRMLGSKQAPAGMTRPAWKQIKAQQATILQAAISRAERGTP